MKQKMLVGSSNGSGAQASHVTVCGTEGQFSPKFPLGQVMATPNALSQLNPSDVIQALRRHAQGDWGDVGSEDWAENERSLSEGYRLFSVYHAAKGTKFWIITEADRSATAVLLPEDY